MNGTRRVLVHPQTQLVRTAVVSDNIEVLLRLGLLREVDISIQDALLPRRRALHQLLAKGRVNHAEAAARADRVCRVPKLVDPAPLLGLLADDLRADHNEARALERHHLREAHAHLVRDVVRPVGLPDAVLVRRVRPEDGPAGDVQIDVLLVLVVAQERLRVLPAVEATDLDRRVERAGRDGLKGLALAVAPVGALDVGRLDLASVVHDDAVLVDEGLFFDT